MQVAVVVRPILPSSSAHLRVVEAVDLVGVLDLPRGQAGKEVVLETSELHPTCSVMGGADWVLASIPLLSFLGCVHHC